MDPRPASDGSSPREEHVARALLALGVIAFAVFHTVLARWKAAGLMSEWPFDVTFFHNLVWNTAEGNGYRQSATYHELPGLFAETHFEPILVLAAPLYKLVPRLETIFAFQSTLLALGAVGIFRLVRAGGGKPMAAVAGAWLYLGWWPVWRIAMSDIRPLSWALPLLILCAAALREGKHWETFAWGVLACMSREEVPLLVLGLCGAALLWRLPPKQERRRTAWLLALATVFFAVASTAMRSNVSFYIRPGDWIRTLLGGENSDGSMAQWGHSAGELFAVRVRFLAEWVVPVGLGALLAPELLAAAAPLFLYLFTQAHEWASWEGPYIHHSAPAMGLVAAAAAVGWTRLWTRLSPPRVAVVGLLVVLGVGEGLVLHGVRIGGEDVVYPRWERHVEEELAPWRQQHERVVQAHRLAALVPDDASVMADWHTIHLFSGREHVYGYHQEAPDEITPGPGEPMLPKAAEQPRWALINLEDPPWMARAEAHGLVERDRGGDWVLYGPAR